MNGAGKTSVLEIPFLLAAGSNASSAMKLYNFRNEYRVAPNLQRPFTGLFYELDVSESIIIEGEGGVLPSEAEKAHRRLLISPIYGPGGDVTWGPKPATAYEGDRVAGMGGLEQQGYDTLGRLTGQIGGSPLYNQANQYLTGQLGGAPQQAGQWWQAYQGGQQNLQAREAQGVQTAEGGTQFQQVSPQEANISKWKAALPTFGETEVYPQIEQLIGGATDPQAIQQLFQQGVVPQAQRGLAEQQQQIAEDFSFQGTPYGTQQAFALQDARQRMDEQLNAQLTEMLMGGQERAIQGAGILGPLAQTEFGGGIEALKLSEVEAQRMQEAELAKAQMDLERWKIMQGQEGMQWQDITQLGAQADQQAMQQGFQSETDALQRQLESMGFLRETEMLPWEQAQIAMDQGSVQRQIEQAIADADYEEALRMMGENNPQMQNFYQMISAFMGAEQVKPESGGK